MKDKKTFLLFLFIIAVFMLWNPFIIADSNYVQDSNFNNTVVKTSEYIKKVMKENNIIGLSIALVYKDKIVWADSFGWADRENKIPAEVDTIYMLGSGSKTITTVALLQYMDKGILKLDDAVDKYIPEFKMLPRFNNQAKELTIRRLLNHHSGIPGDLYNNMGVEKTWEKWGNNLYVDWLIDYLNHDYLSYKPGEIAIYSNTGFILAGEIVKRLSGDKKASFNKIVTDNLLIPLGMKNSSLNLINKNLAKGYIQGSVTPPIQFNGIAGATGGLFTNVIDTSKFIAMLLNGGSFSGKRILNPETVQVMGESEISPLDINSYFIPGLGFDCVRDASLSYAGQTWIKDGSTGNYNSIMGLLPDKKLGVIILTNCDTSHLLKYSIMRECLKNALEEKFNLKPVKPKLPDMKSVADPEKIVGMYMHMSGLDEIVKLDNNNNKLLWKKNITGSKSPICNKLRFNGTRFTVEGASEEIVFKNIDGHFVMIQYGSSGSDSDKYEYDNYVMKIIAEKHQGSDSDISDLWKKRLKQKYIINNIGWNSSTWDDDLILYLTEKNGKVFVSNNADKILLYPKNKEAAFVQGLDNRTDSSVRFSKVNELEIINYAGYTGIDIEKIMDITNSKVIERQKIEFPDTLWYRIDVEKNQSFYNIKIKSSTDKYELRLFNSSFKLISFDSEKLSHCLQKEKYYLAVTSKPKANGYFDLAISCNTSNQK